MRARDLIRLLLQVPGDTPVLISYTLANDANAEMSAIIEHNWCQHSGKPRYFHKHERINIRHRNSYGDPQTAIILREL